MSPRAKFYQMYIQSSSGLIILGLYTGNWDAQGIALKKYLIQVHIWSFNMVLVCVLLAQFESRSDHT